MSHYSIRLAGRKDFLNEKGEQCMRTTAFGIHMGLSNHAISLSSSHQFKTLIWLIDSNLIESFHVYAVLFILMNQ